MGKKKKPAMTKAEGRSSSISPEMRAHMDYVYEGALAICKKYGITGASYYAGGPTRRLKGAGKTHGALAPPSELIEWVAANRAEYPKATHLIRAVATTFPQATVGEIRAALPELNPSTVGIQVGKARQSGATE